MASAITLGFDGSRYDDATALIATEVESGFQWPLGIWMHDGTPNWEVPITEVDGIVSDAFERFYRRAHVLRPAEVGELGLDVGWPVRERARARMVDEPPQADGVCPPVVHRSDRGRRDHAQRRQGRSSPTSPTAAASTRTSSTRGPAALDSPEGAAGQPEQDRRRDGRESLVGSAERRGRRGRRSQEWSVAGFDLGLERSSCYESMSKLPMESRPLRLASHAGRGARRRESAQRPRSASRHPSPPPRARARTSGHPQGLAPSRVASR
jgi:hypothetical protein